MKNTYPLSVESNDNRVIAEMKRRGLWIYFCQPSPNRGSLVMWLDEERSNGIVDRTYFVRYSGFADAKENGFEIIKISNIQRHGELVKKMHEHWNIGTTAVLVDGSEAFTSADNGSRVLGMTEDILRFPGLIPRPPSSNEEE